jgi:hypothetical protein
MAAGTFGGIARAQPASLRARATRSRTSAMSGAPVSAQRSSRTRAAASSLPSTNASRASRGHKHTVPEMQPAAP